MLEKLTRPIKLGIAGLGLLGLIGCESKATVTERNKIYPLVNDKYTIISGIPLSVEQNTDGHGYKGRFATVVDVDGKKIFAYNPSSTGNSERLDAATIIKSEIADADSGKVELTGRYESPTTFKIKAVRANELEVRF